MSMLAGPRRKQKWTLNPRGKNWAEDSNKFGQKMLEKMGWTSGKGLGANEQGTVDHIRVKVKNDQVGIGFDKNKDDHWTEHQDSFNDFLQNLQKEQSVDSANAATEVDKALSGKSLEEKSKQSQKRVHYKKFTRGKDVNKYSTKDLANIFGKKDLNEKPVKEEKVEEDEEKFQDPVGTKDTTAGILTIKGGSMTDYFKKLHNGEQKSTTQDVDDSDSESDKRTGFGFTEKCRSKFYLNDNASPEKNDTESDIGKYAGFGFTKSSESKSKSKKLNNLDYVFDNPCLDLNILDSPVPRKIKSENSNLEHSNKATPRKRKSDFIYDNQGLDLECPDRPTPKKRRSEFLYENEGLDLEYPDNFTKANEESNSNIHESESYDADYSNKITPKKSKKSKKGSISNGYENPALDLDCSEKSTPKKSKKDKNECVFAGFENAGLDLEYPDKPTPKKIKNKKESEDLSSAYENPALDLEFSETPNKNLTEVDFEGMANQTENIDNLECLEKMTPKKSKRTKKGEGLSIPNGIENPALDLEFPDKPTPRKTKKNKEDEVLSGIENPALDLECVENPTPKKMKKRKNNMSMSGGFENSALDLDTCVNIVDNASDFEVLRTACGVENSGLDLSDENSSKKRVTFNDQVEYNTDIVKKKKKKRKLDKYEVENEKMKKKNKPAEPTTFVNEALDLEIINEEEIDNEINERKSKKGKRRKDRRMSLLETIEEAPEEENAEEIEMNAENNSDIEIIKELVHENQNDKMQEIMNDDKPKQKHKKKKKKKAKIEDTINIDESDEDSVKKDKIEEIDISEESNDAIKKKKKKKKSIKIENIDESKVNGKINEVGKENICFDGEETENSTEKKGEKKKRPSDEDVVSLQEFLNEEPETFSSKNKEIEITKTSENDSTVNHFQKIRKTKEVMKSLFMKNPTLLFNGANINEIKGYGSNIQNGS